MNKKIVSFVLAMVLSVGLGVSAAFAGYSYSDYADKFNSYYAGKTASGSVKIKIGSEEDKLKGNLTGVFGYYAGTMVSYQGAGGSFTVYDSFGARGTLSNSGEQFKLTSWTSRTADLADMPDLSEYVEYENGKPKTDSEGHYVFKSEEAKKAYVKAMTDYLISIGFTKEQLAVAQLDDEGNLLGPDTDGDGKPDPVKYSDQNGNGFDGELLEGEISADWFVEWQTQMEKGVNASAQISIGNGVSGPSLTVMENGKPQLVFSTDPTTGGAIPTMRYVYDERGYLIGTQTAEFQIEKAEGDSGYAQGSWTYNYTAITYDSNGVETDTTYQFPSWQADPQAAISGGNVIHGGEMSQHASDEGENKWLKKKLEEGCVLEIAKTTYTNNNSKLKTVDYTTNNTTYYTNGKASYVLNETGEKIGQYEYSANGVCQAYYNAKGTDGHGNTVGTTTVYDDWGRALFTATTGTANELLGNTARREQLMQEYYTALTSGNGFSDNTTICGVYIYADYASSDLGGKSIAWGSLGYTANDVKNMMKFNNGVAALAYTTIDTTEWTEESGDTAGIVTDSASHDSTNVSASFGSHHQYSTYSTGRRYSGHKTYNNTIFIGGSQAYSRQCRIADKITDVTYIETDPAVKGEIVDIDEELDKIEVTDEELEAAGVDPKDKKAVKEYKLSKLADKLGLDKPSREDYASDEEYEAALDTFYGNLEQGFYTASDGKVYAILASSEIDLMDGSGFQQTEGETILVEVTEDMKESIVSSMAKTGDRSVMFMGDVRPDVSGKLTMAVNTNYTTSQGNGFVVGKEAIETATKEIESISTQVADIANELGIDMSQFAGMSAEEIRNSAEFAQVCDKLGLDKDGENTWIVVNSLQNNGRFGGSFDVNGENKRGSLEDAWRILLQF